MEIPCQNLQKETLLLTYMCKIREREAHIESLTLRTHHMVQDHRALTSKDNSKSFFKGLGSPWQRKKA